MSQLRRSLANIDVTNCCACHTGLAIRYTLQRGDIGLEQIDQAGVAAVELIILSSCHVIIYHNSRLLLSKQELVDIADSRVPNVNDSLFLILEFEQREFYKIELRF